jgi:hypothetical protein
MPEPRHLALSLTQVLNMDCIRKRRQIVATKASHSCSTVIHVGFALITSSTDFVSYDDSAMETGEAIVVFITRRTHTICLVYLRIIIKAVHVNASLMHSATLCVPIRIIAHAKAPLKCLER